MKVANGICALILALLLTLSASAGTVLRRAFDDYSFASCRGGRELILECHLPQSDSAARLVLQRYLANATDYKQYLNVRVVPIPFDKLKPEVQRELLLTAFPKDFVDESGWTHIVVFPDGEETLWSLCEWLTGKGATYQAVRQDNAIASLELVPGQTIFIAKKHLRDVMRTPTVSSSPPPPLANLPEVEPIPLTKAAADLRYGKDQRGEYAAYKLQEGEALYTSVVMRFTGRGAGPDPTENNKAVWEAIRIIQAFNNISDAQLANLKTGQEIRIPVALLDNRFQPEGTAGREEYQESLNEAQRLRSAQPKSQDLRGVVVILDPGHGGRDRGAYHFPTKLYEDELNYDIAMRIKKLLEEETAAKVHVTVKDKSRGFNIRDDRFFSHDKDEILLTSPPYSNDDARVSANLRWALANSIYRKERAAGVNEKNIVFTSIHCDQLRDSIRGTMIYIPGAQYRNGTGRKSGVTYASYVEMKGQPSLQFSYAERRRDEGLSRNFAEDLVHGLRSENIMIHHETPTIRNVVHRSRNETWLPAVLKYNEVPTKVLIETANLGNATDRDRLADPEWRQMYARAYVYGLKRYYNAN